MTDPYYADATVRIFHGDCVDVLRELPDASVDAVVTDPPYLLGFMGREWDTKAAHQHLDWHRAWCDHAYRVLKPGGHMLAFGGTRTSHRLACAVEDAGFEIRDSIAWLYGSGFPKSLDVSKAIDKAAGAEREVMGPSQRHVSGKPEQRTEGLNGTGTFSETIGMGAFITAPATDAARTWQGWGTALKPAHEPIVVARKPLAGTVAANVLAHGTGALNVDACRVDGVPWKAHRATGLGSVKFFTEGETPEIDKEPHAAGRWPANVVLDESQAAALDAQSGTVGGGDGKDWSGGPTHGTGDGATYLASKATGQHYGDLGGASRFFYTAREDEPCTETPTTDASTNNATAADAEPKSTTPTTPEDGASTTGPPTTLADQLDARFKYTAKAPTDERPRINGVAHPTTKPLALMRWLVRLVCPPGGTVLEPFAGSGTTVEACILEGFACIAIEREADYLPLIRQRIHRRRDPVEAVRGSGEDAGLFDLLGGEPA